MPNKIILHLDMNSYFASVEQQANPFLRGKPVAVCAYLSPGGCIIASSREAKAKGIKTGMRVKDALKFDSKVVLLENEPAKYRSTTEKIFKILGRYTDTVEPYSIDEAFLDLSGWVKNFKEAEKVGRQIKEKIKLKAGEWLNCSIGISWTKFLAKFAGDIAPKAAILTIDRENIDQSLNKRPLKDAWGINNAMEARLNFLGISNLLELKKCSPDLIRRKLGRCGYYLWAGVNGIEISSISRGAPSPKSIGHSYCLPKKTTDKKYLRAVLYKLCEKTGRRLRANELEAQQINLGLAYTRDGGIWKGFKTADKMFATEEIAGQALAFLDKTNLIMPVSMLAVSVTRLTPLSSQLSLFGNNLAKKRLSRAIDKINDKYGEYTLVRGAMFGTNDLARDRIGYRKVV